MSPTRAFALLEARPTVGISATAGGSPRAGGGAPAETFEGPLERPQSPVDLSNIGGNGTRISGLTKHDWPHPNKKSRKGREHGPLLPSGNGSALLATETICRFFLV